jgi:hypothetical protein
MMNLPADDCVVGVSSGNASILNSSTNGYNMQEKECDIAMEYEHITIYMNDHNYSVDATFCFYNNGDDTTILTGFPEYQGRFAFTSFSTYVDGLEVKYEHGEDTFNDGADSKSWYVKQVHFDKNQVRMTRVTYTSRYGSYGGGSYCDTDGFLFYTYGTGRNWYGPIGKIVIDIINESPDVYITGLTFINEKYEYGKMPKAYKMSWLHSNTLRLEADNVNPASVNDNINIDTHFFTILHNNTPNDSGYKGTYLQRKANDINMSLDLSLLSSKQLRYMRNDYYAIHGYIFEQKDIKSYYESIPSYVPNTLFRDDMLTSEQKSMIKKIENEEEKRKAKDS